MHFCSVTLIDLSSVNSLSTAAGFLCLKTVATLGIAAIDTNRTLADVGTVAGKWLAFREALLLVALLQVERTQKTQTALCLSHEKQESAVRCTGHVLQ